MEVMSREWMATFWSQPFIAANLAVFLNLLGALALGLLVGYERAYHGRAAGMRTYGIVCMASAALTVFAGYPAYWFGGQQAVHGVLDPTRVVQGIVTGIGFLGAGVIMKEGMNISGLTTAASIWATSAIGVLVGVGFFAAAILLAGLSAALMMWGTKVEMRLPTRPAVGLHLRFAPGHAPSRQAVQAMLAGLGYDLATGSIAITGDDGWIEWRFVAVGYSLRQAAPLPEIAAVLSGRPEVARFHIEHARN